ncbi:MAG: DoxX family membrane protein [candidate division KSB1 bacterium]|nr:DoxX family membrane protein [candidate division KSB1 bacterium]MDZ7345266.1 DoxX family membrane protein [candidate division KSB1 bacterium]
MKQLLSLLRFVLGGIFVYAALGKILDPTQFAESIDNYRLLPYFLTTLTAAILPWLELICGFLLILGRKVAAASLIIIVLNCIFILAIGSAVARGLDIDCGCFSAGSKVGWVRLIEDFALLAVAVVIWKEARTLQAR